MTYDPAIVGSGGAAFAAAIRAADLGAAAVVVEAGATPGAGLPPLIALTRPGDGGRPLPGMRRPGGGFRGMASAQPGRGRRTSEMSVEGRNRDRPARGRGDGSGGHGAPSGPADRFSVESCIATPAPAPRRASVAGRGRPGSRGER